MLAFEMIGWRHYWSRILRITTIRIGDVFDIISNSEISREVFLICRKSMSLLWGRMSLWILIICRKISVIRSDCHQSRSSLNEIFSKIESWKIYIGHLIRDPDWYDKTFVRDLVESQNYDHIFEEDNSRLDISIWWSWRNDFRVCHQWSGHLKRRAIRSRENLHIRKRLELNSHLIVGNR